LKNRNIAVIVVIIFILSCHTKPFADSIDVCEINNNYFNNVTEVNREFKPEKIQNVPRYTLKFIAGGDNLYHYSVLRGSMIDGEYHFLPIYSYITDIVKSADLAFLNQETIMGGTRFGYTGFPSFNTPQILASVLVEAGFDVISLANNHAMDRGAAGLYATLDFLDTIEELTVIGARREGESARIITKNNISLGFLAYSFGMNGGPLPSDNPNLVSLINREVMIREITALRPLCDFLVVSMHWGEEYRLEPDRSQTSLAQFLAEHEVDLVIGHHPHVLQRVETITRPSGGETLVFYSLGNFISNQRERERLIGGMAVVTFVKEGFTLECGEFTGELFMTDTGVLPVVSHFDLDIRNYRVYPLWLYTQELLENHGFRKYDPEGFTIDFFYSVLDRLKTNVIMNNPF
jgi:poly-gamma-glutamate synthesis protein (capsule biosynthesis protein)